jgi:hypothetical protein
LAKISSVVWTDSAGYWNVKYPDTSIRKERVGRVRDTESTPVFNLMIYTLAFRAEMYSELVKVVDVGGRLGVTRPL